MNPTSEEVVQLALALIGLGAFLFLLIERVRIHRRFGQRNMNRLLLIDSLLVIAGLELVADALYELNRNSGGMYADLFQAIAFACRGAIVAGAIALVMTVGDENRFRVERKERTSAHAARSQEDRTSRTP